MNNQEIENNLGRIHEWIKSVDQKVSVFLAFQGVVLTILFSDVFLWTKRNIHSFSCIDTILIISGVVLIGYSIYKSISAIIPRLKNHKGHKSLTYFKDIAESNLKDYKKQVRETSNSEYQDELINQVHISATIAKRKHEEFRDSIVFFFIGLLLLIFIFLIVKVFYGN